jgi:molecular chaperone DnaJ
MDVSDIFSMFDDIFGGLGGGAFGGRGGGRARAPRGFDLETQVELSLTKSLPAPKKRSISRSRTTAKRAKGSGRQAGSQPLVCPQCGGQGRIAQQGFGADVPHGHDLPQLPGPRVGRSGPLSKLRRHRAASFASVS